MFIRWPGDKSKTLSQNAARSKYSSFYYFGVFVVFLLLFGIFMIGWFIPHLNLSLVFTVIFVLGVAGQFIAVTIPETKGLQKTIHIAAAGVMSLMTLLITVYLTANTNLITISRVVSGVVAVLMLISWLLVIFYKKIYKHALLLQVLYFFGFFIAIITVTYLN